MKFSQKTENRTDTWSNNSTPGNISKKTKTLIWKDMYTPIIIAALLTKIWKQSKCPSTDEWLKKMYTQWNTTQWQKEQNFAISSYLDGLGGDYDKWNSQTKTNIVFYLDVESKTYNKLVNNKKANSEM